MTVVSSGSTRFGRPAQVCSWLLVDMVLFGRMQAGMPSRCTAPYDAEPRAIQVSCTGCTTCVCQPLLRNLLFGLLQTLTIPDARSVSAFPSPEAAALQPPEPAPSTGSTPVSSLQSGWGRSSLIRPNPQLASSLPTLALTSSQASTINSMQHLPTSNSTGSLPILYGTSNTNIFVGSPERGRRPATKPSSPKKRLGLDSPAARALRAADTKTLDKGSLIFVMGSKGNSLTAKQVHRVNQLQLGS